MPADVVSASIAKLRRDIIFRSLAANGRQSQARVRLSDTGVVEWQLPDVREAGAAAATARACGSWLLRLDEWPRQLSPLAPLRERLRQEPPCKAWLAAIPLIAAVPGASIDIADAGDGWLLIDGLLSASHEALGVLRMLLAPPERPAEDGGSQDEATRILPHAMSIDPCDCKACGGQPPAGGTRDGKGIAAMLEAYVVDLRKRAKDAAMARGDVTISNATHEAAEAARDFMALGWPRMRRRLADAELLTPGEATCDNFGRKLGYVARQQLGWNPPAKSPRKASDAQASDLFRGGASKVTPPKAGGTKQAKGAASPSRITDAERCLNCRIYRKPPNVRGGDPFAGFCENCSSRLNRSDMRAIRSGDARPAWERMGGDELAEYQRVADEAGDLEDAADIL